MFRDFFARPWIKKEVLSYLFDKEKYQKTPVRAIRAQVIRFINYEELEPNELMSAEIHDNQYYIKCFFTDESLYEFNRHSIDYMVGTLIIIRDYTFSHEIDSSKNKHECFLTIKNFTYTKNITDLEEHSLQIKYICEEMEVKETPKHIDHPGWNGFRYTFYSNSVDIRTVPLHQYKLMSDIPGWNFSQRNHRNNDLCVKIESNEWSPGSPESPRHDSDGAISLNEEDIAIIMKGNSKERENYRSDTLDDEEVHFERTKRKYVDSNNDDISSKKHKNSPSTFCSYV